MSEERSKVPHVVVKVICHHLKGESFAMVAERDGRQYAMVAGSGQPSVTAVTGVVTISQPHNGFDHHGLQAIGETTGPEEPDLDPIVEAMRRRGMEHDHLRMRATRGARSWEEDSSYDLGSSRKAKCWDGSTDRYVILPPNGEPLAWYVLSHLAEHGHFHVVVSVPRVYDPVSLASFLAVVATLPIRLPPPVAGVNPAV